MPRYLIVVYHDDASQTRPIAEMRPIWNDIGAFNEQAVADGSFVFAAGLTNLSQEITVDAVDA